MNAPTWRPVIAWGRRTASAALVAALSLTTSCKGCGGSNEEPAAQVAVESEVPAPKDLVAEIVLPSPGTTWTRLQRGLGGAVGLLPPSFASAAVLALGLDPALAGEVDPTSPAYGVVAGDLASPSWAFAVRASDMRHARAVLAGGDSARNDAREVAGLVELVPKSPPSDPSRPPPPVVGLTKGGFVVLASTSSALASLGPYVARTMPTRPLPTSSAAVVDVPRESVRTLLAPRAAAAWKEQKELLLARDEEARRAHGGRAPDFGDPKAIVATLDRLATDGVDRLADVDHARLALDVLEDDVRAVVTLAPVAGDGPASRWISAMIPADPKVVLAMPRTSLVAGAYARRAAPDADAGVGVIGQGFVGALDGRLAKGDDEKLRAALASLADATASGEKVAFAANVRPPRGLYVRMPVPDREATARALRDVASIAGAPPISELLKVKGVRFGDEDVDGIGKVTLATFVRATPAPTRRPAPEAARGSGERAIGWTFAAEDLVVAAGEDPRSTIRAYARPDGTLGDEPAVKRVLGASSEADDVLGTVLVAQPFELDELRAPLPSAPVALTMGRKGRDAVLRVTAPYALLRELGRLRISP